MCGCNKKPAPAYAAPAAVPRAFVAPVLPTVDTSIWGPPLWSALHRAAQFGSDDRFSAQWSSVFSAMKTDLPCPDCTAHYNAWYTSQFQPIVVPQVRSMYRPMAMMMRGRRVQTQAAPVPIPIPVQTRILNLHNDVNQRTGKPVWDLQQINDMYGGDKTTQLAITVAALQSLQGVIGSGLYDTLMALLQTL